jgi:hypothetical protein
MLVLFFKLILELLFKGRFDLAILPIQEYQIEFLEHGNHVEEHILLGVHKLFKAFFVN